MITYVSGNILDAPVEALVNPVNCVGVMGCGLAAAFKAKYPTNFEAYYWACRKKQVKLGDVFAVEVLDELPVKYIVNFPTKLHWKDSSQLVKICFGLTSLKRWIKREGIKSIAIPRIGCGCGKLKWPEVKSFLVNILGTDLDDVEIMVYGPA